MSSLRLPLNDLLELAKEAKNYENVGNFSEIEINQDYDYNESKYYTSISPIYKNNATQSLFSLNKFLKQTKGVVGLTDNYTPGFEYKLAVVAKAFSGTIPTEATGYNEKQYKELKAFRNIYCAKFLREEDKKTCANVKYLYNTFCYHTNGGSYLAPLLTLPNEIVTYDNSFKGQLRVAKINQVGEIIENGVNYRYIFVQNYRDRDMYYYPPALFLVDTESPFYNYLDRDFFFVTMPSHGRRYYEERDLHKIIVNQLTLETNYILMAFLINPTKVLKHLDNGVFLDASKAKITLLKIEKDLSDEERRLYRPQKELVLAHFQATAQNTMFNKMIHGEIEKIVLNNVTLTPNRASYENVYIEAEGLMKAVAKNLNVNDTFDIYEVIYTYGSYIANELQNTPLNAAGTAFSESKTFNLEINGIPITVAINIANTRRYVNGYLINKDELNKVIRRASCHFNTEDYNNFLKAVSRQSLDVCDVLSNGLPIWLKSSHAYYQDGVLDKTQPKLSFKKEDGKYYLKFFAVETQKEGDKETSKKVEKLYHIPKFVGFIDTIRATNKRVDGGWSWDHEKGRRVQRDGNWCADRVKAILTEFLAVGAEEANKLTTELLDSYLTELERLRAEAEKKSEALLKEVVEQVGAEYVTDWKQHNNAPPIKGYKVKGLKRTYIVNEENMQVWNFDTKTYVCIVKGKNDLGVGKDAMVTYLLALANDSMMANHITTLK